MTIWWIVIAIFFILAGSLAYGAMAGAPWVPTFRKDFDRIVDLAGPKQGDVLYELGCGSAWLSIEMAKRYGVRAVGVELSIIQVLMAKWRARKVDGVEIKWANMFNVDLSDADIVYLFLVPDTYEKLSPKLKSEMKPGSKVVSYVWEVQGLDVEEVSRSEDSPDIFLHRISGGVE